VNSRGTPRFWAAYHELPEPAREAARKAYRLFRENPNHPSLQFKKIHAREPIYSVRVTLGYRAVGRSREMKSHGCGSAAMPITTDF
jgi:hypothetical protein